MPINLSSIETEFQRRANAVDSATDTLSILNLLQNINKTSTVYFGYDSDQLLPTGDSDLEGLITVSNNRFKFYSAQKDSWFNLDSSSITAAAAAAVTQAMGTNYGYIAGGSVNVIEKFTFASDANSTDVGDTPLSLSGVAGASSTTHGYASGGYNSAQYPSGAPVYNKNTIDKFAFAADGNASTITATLSQKTTYAAGGLMSTSNAYVAGGGDNTTSSPYIWYDIIDKFPFASDTTNAVDTGNLITRVLFTTGMSSADYGYVGSGNSPVPPFTFVETDTIQKFAYASDGNALDVGNLLYGTRAAMGQNSTTDGYFTSGRSPSHPVNFLRTDIEKIPFASDGNSVDVGDILGSSSGTGVSSSTDGYVAGSPSITNQILRFPFANESTYTDAGDLTITNRSYGAGAQY